MAEGGQTYATHTRWNPSVHFFLSPLFLINLIAAAWAAVRNPSGASLWAALMALGLLVFLFAARLMALSVQDRVIRLEERLRMREILPADLQSSSQRRFVRKEIRRQVRADHAHGPRARHVRRAEEMSR